MQPEFKELPAFPMIGYTREFTPETMPTISDHWQRNGPKLAELPTADEKVCYGLTYDHKSPGHGGPSMKYMVAVEARPEAAVPEGVSRVDIPAAKYAVFTFDDHISKIGEFIDRVWKEFMPAGNLTRAEGGFDFERYDTRWNPETGTGPVDYFVAVELR